MKIKAYKLIASGIHILFITAIAIHLQFDALAPTCQVLDLIQLAYNSICINYTREWEKRNKQTEYLAGKRCIPPSLLNYLTKGGTVGSPLPSE